VFKGKNTVNGLNIYELLLLLLLLTFFPVISYIPLWTGKILSDVISGIISLAVVVTDKSWPACPCLSSFWIQRSRH